MNELPAFPPTQWTRLEREGGTAEGREWFCETYRPVVLACLRARCGADEAEDLCQEFFSQVVLERNLPGRAERGRGSLRALLQTALGNFLSNHRRRQRARKRGGGAGRVALDQQPSTAPFFADGTAPAPDREFDRAWAEHLLERAVAAVEAECGRRGKERLFAALRPALDGSGLPRSHAEIAGELGLKVREVTLALSRLRQLTGKFLYEEVSRTVSGAGDMDAEWGAVRQALHEA